MKSPVASPPCNILVAAGEIVLVEGVWLLDDAPERLPAHQLVEARHDHLLLDHGVGDHDERADDEHQPEEGDQFDPVVGEKLRRRRLFQQVDQPAERPVERGVDRARQAAGDEQQHERPLGLPREIENEGARVARQHLPFRVGKGLDDLLRLAPDTLGEGVVLALAYLLLLDPAHSAAASLLCSSSSRNPPDCLCHSWA
jgi:hypothetical protein